MAAPFSIMATAPRNIRIMIPFLVGGVLIDSVQTLSKPAEDGRGWFIAWVALFVVTQAVYFVFADRAVTGPIGIVVPLIELLCFGLAGSYGSSNLWYIAVLTASWLGLRLGYRGIALTASVTVPLGLIGLLMGTGTGHQTAQEVFTAWAVVTIAGLPAAIARASFADATRRLRRSRRLQASIVESVDVGILYVDRSGRPVSMNAQQQAYTRLAGPGADGPGGEEIFDADGRTPLPPDRMPIRRALRGDFEREPIWVGSDPATRRALEVTGRRMLDDRGRVEGATLAFHDVTTLTRAMQVKDDFVAAISHELRTPLTSIVGFVELLDEEELSPIATAHLARVHHNARRLRTLVEDLLSASSYDAEVHRHRLVDLATLVPPVVESLSVQASTAGVTLRVETEPAPVLGDPKRLEQVLVNLVSNAVKYTPGGGSVTVQTRSDGDVVRLRVIDTGMGMSETVLEQLFERFFRSEDVRSSGIPGVGLGLAITRDIVRAHGGDVLVTSALGEGSTFDVCLPQPGDPS